MPIEHIFDACMVVLSCLIHVNKLLIVTKPIRNLPMPATAINKQKPILTAGSLSSPLNPPSLFLFLPLPSTPAMQTRRYEIHLFIVLFNFSHITVSRIYCFSKFYPVRVSRREQIITSTYITLSISFPLLSILGVFHRSRVLCPPFLSLWFLNITIYLEKFKTKNNFHEC